MAKKPGRNSQPAPISTTQPNSTSIDDIFASGSSSKPLKPLAHPSSSTSASKHKVDARLPEATQDKTDKKKKRPKSVPTFNPDLASTANPGVPSITKTKAEPQSKSKPKSKPTVVETIYDPSAQTRSVPVRPVKDVKGTKRSRLAVEEDEAFRDSRGDGPSKYSHLNSWGQRRHWSGGHF